MSKYVVDTHVLHWHLTNNTSRLSSKAQQLLIETDAGHHQIFVPSIVLVEMVYLTEKGRLGPTLLQTLLRRLNTPRGSYTIAPLDIKTAQALLFVPRDAVPDMPDRIIVATARQLNLPLISRDSMIQQANVVPVIW